MKTLFETDSFSISTTLAKNGKDTPKIDGVFFRDIKEKVLGKGYELSLVFIGTDRMRSLNREHRGKDYATDILSFDLDDLSNDDGCGCGDDHDHDGHGHHDDDADGHGDDGDGSSALPPIKTSSDLKYGTGEIFINPDKARAKAKEFDRTFENYLQFLFVHGMMHLKGHDHEDDASAARMEAAERSVRKAFGI